MSQIDVIPNKDKNDQYLSNKLNQRIGKKNPQKVDNSRKNSIQRKKQNRACSIDENKLMGIKKNPLLKIKKQSSQNLNLDSSPTLKKAKLKFRAKDGKKYNQKIHRNKIRENPRLQSKMSSLQLIKTPKKLKKNENKQVKTPFSSVENQKVTSKAEQIFQNLYQRSKLILKNYEEKNKQKDEQNTLLKTQILILKEQNTRLRSIKSVQIFK